MFTNNQLKLIHKLATDQIKLIPLYFRDGHKDYYELLDIELIVKRELQTREWKRIKNETMDQNSNKVG